MVVQQVVLHKVIVALLPLTRLIHISLGQFSIHGMLMRIEIWICNKNEINRNLTIYQ